MRKLRETVQGTSSRSQEAAKPIDPSAESRIDKKKAKGSRSNYTAMRADVQDQQNSALDRVQSATWKHIARRDRVMASGRKWIPAPRRRIYVDVCETIDELTSTNFVHKVTMVTNGPGGRHRGYAFVTIAWPSELNHNGVDMDTFCEAIHHLNVKGRPIYAEEAHHRDE